MHDLGIALKSTRLEDALGHLGIRGQVTGTQVDPDEEIESLAVSAGLRSRRVLLSSSWWRGVGTPMLARVADRRRNPRSTDPAQPDVSGWVALVPRFFGGYGVGANDPGDARALPADLA